MVVPRKGTVVVILGSAVVFGSIPSALRDLSAARSGGAGYGKALGMLAWAVCFGIVWLALAVHWLRAYPLRRMKERWAQRFTVSSEDTIAIGPIENLSGKALAANLKTRLPESMLPRLRSFHLARNSHPPLLHYHLVLMGRDPAYEKVVVEKDLVQELWIDGNPVSGGEASPGGTEVELPVSEPFPEYHLHIRVEPRDSRSEQPIPIHGGEAMEVQIRLGVALPLRGTVAPSSPFNRATARILNKV